ncbi:MAG: hypothetical protein CMJ83_08820, partial [Planctomycetes bacterium]|nr:hypothetical protein [Planctomycetota bacterium]
MVVFLRVGAAQTPWLTVVGEGRSDRPVVCGVLRDGTAARRAARVGLVDASGRAVPSGVHRSGGRVLVHTVAAPGGVGPARRRARTVPAIDVRFDPDLRIDTGAIVVTLEPGGCLRALGVRWRLVPWGGASAPWRVVHR